MPTLALPPQPAIVVRFPAGMENNSPGNGTEASHLSKLADDVASHWLQRAEVLTACMDYAETESEYRHPLLRTQSIVKVRYRMSGRLRPRRFQTDD